LIFDSLSNADDYFTADWWREMLAYIRAATPALPDGVHPVRGDEIVARVHTGQTRMPENAVLESHRTYVDVHVVLDGRETIAVWPADGLHIRTPYNQQQDVVFYERPDAPGTRLDLSPGFFAVFFPQDAHMTQLMDREQTTIKKLVMKVAVDLIGQEQPAR
jgi:YhcH/YjgK/YiaL family protein